MEAITNFDSTKESLKDLLRSIHQGKTQLPDFQRGWVWDDEHVKSLLASVSQAYPIGAVMVLETGNPLVKFKPRTVEGVELSSVPDPERLILDGQQRLTSLYQALMIDQPVTTFDAKGVEIRRWYYIDLAKALDPSLDREDAIVGMPPDRVLKNFRGEIIRDVSTQNRECADGLLPVSRLFDVGGLMSWQMTYLQADPDQMASRLATWERIVEEIVQPFEQYQIPLIQLRKGTSKDAVCRVFEKVNTGGVSLTVFELLTATYAADNFSLRDDWNAREKELRRYNALRNVASTDLLQTVTLLSTLERRRISPDAAVSCKRRDILQLELDEYLRRADDAVAGFIRAAKFLHAEKIFAARDIPYRTQLVPLAAIFADLGTEADKDGVVARVRRWYWCGVLGELYGSAIESRFARDLPQVLEWIGGGAEPDTVTEANFQPIRLRTLRSRNSAAYKGIHALLMRDGAIDFQSGSPIDSQIYFDESIDIHHIFPVAWAMKHPEIPMTLIDSIVNKTPISSKTNKTIGRAAPSVYLARLEKSAGISILKMADILRSHMIDSASLEKDDFRGFFAAREEALLDRIENATGKPIVRTSETIDVLEGDGGDIEVGQALHIPGWALAVVVVEGTTDEEYMRIAAEKCGRGDLLSGVHVVAAGGVDKAVLQALLIKNQTDLPLIAVFDKDGPGKGGRESLKARFGFHGTREVLTYADIFEGSPDGVEAEDLFPPELLQRFTTEMGEENVLAEKQMSRALGRWHYGFNALGKELIGEFMREEAQPEDFELWIKLLTLIRSRVGLPIPPAPGTPPPTEPPIDPIQAVADSVEVAEETRQPAPKLPPSSIGWLEDTRGYDPESWYTARQQMRETLIATARRKSVIPYSELAKTVTAIPNELGQGGWPFSFNYLLGQVAAQEYFARGPVLSAVAVYKDEMKPGPGFAEIVRELGVPGSDDPLAVWVDQLKKCHSYY